MVRLLRLLRRFQSDESGAFLVLFGVLAIVLVATAGAVVDYTSVEQARGRAQDALDSAALGLQQTLSATPKPTEAQLRDRAQLLVAERLANDNVSASVTGAVVDPDNTLRLEASLTVPTAFVSLVGINEISASLLSEVKRGGANIEVAVALDTTGSMSGSKIADLREATKELIDLVVQNQQSPFYSKIALVPYSMGVNVGSYAASVRGSIASGKPITAADWRVANSQKTISAITKDNPARITTSSNHGYSTGDRVYVSGVNGMTQINGGPYTITRVSSTRFTLNGVNSTYWSTFSSYGSPTVAKCVVNSCEVVVTASSHGFDDDDKVFISGANLSAINNSSSNMVWTVDSTGTNTFVLEGLVAPSGTYSSGGTAYCTEPGCQYYYFQSAPGSNPSWPYNWYGSGQWNLFQVSTCVSERTGANAYTDVAPSTTAFGRNYPPTVYSQYYTSNNYNPCIGQQIVPLSTNKVALKAVADTLTASGSTGGHIGLAWAWYMVSPNFAYLWPEASRPDAYGTKDLVKAVVLMTDGQFNTVYCNGVIAKNSVSGSGTPLYHNDCNAPNGDSYDQGEDICDGIKAAGVVVYTVGFDIADQQEAKDLMANCASSPEFAFLANSGTELKDAFRAIGANIASLRVSR